MCYLPFLEVLLSAVAASVKCFVSHTSRIIPAVNRVTPGQFSAINPKLLLGASCGCTWPQSLFEVGVVGRAGHPIDRQGSVLACPIAL